MSYNSASDSASDRKEEWHPSRSDSSGNKIQMIHSDSRDLPQPFTPRAVVLSHESSDLNDLFEGEPDSDLFPLSSPNHPGVLSTWLAFQDRHAREKSPDADEPYTFVNKEAYLMASGGLGEEDLSYDESKCRQRHESSIVHLHDPDETDVARPSTYQMSGSVWNELNCMDEHAHNRAYLASLRSDALCKYRDTPAVHDCDEYSATGSSDSISVFDDGTPSALNVECIKDPTLRPPPAQTCVADPTSTSSIDRSSNKPTYGEKHDDFHFGFSATESTQSAFWHSRSYLSEVTPTDTRAHHPSIIPRLIHGSMSCASSLVDELLKEEESQPSLEACQPKDDRHSSTNISLSTELASSIIPGNEIMETTPAFTAFGSPPESQKSPARLDDMDSSNQPCGASFLYRQFDVKPPDIRKPGVLATQDVDSTQSARSDGSSRVAPLGLADSSFQYNSARLTPPLRSPQGSDQEFAQHVSPCHPISHKVYASDQPEADQDMDQNGSHTNQQRHTPVAEATAVVTAMVSVSEDGLDAAPEDQRLHQEVVAVIQQLGPNDSSVQGLIAPKISVVTDIIMSSPYSPPPADPAHSSNNSSPPSPIAGLQNALHVAKRGSRKATATRKAIVDPGNTRGHAISASPSKRKATATRKSTLAAGVQGGASKVTKSRTTRAAGSTSRKSTAVMRDMISSDADTPPVPKLPNDMDLHLPKLRLQLDTLSKDVQVLGEYLTAAKEAELANKRVPINATVTTITDVAEAQDSSQLSEPSSQEPGTSTYILSLQLHVPKTRKSAKPDSVAVFEETETPLDEHSLIVEAMATEHGTNLPQTSTMNHKTKESTPSPRKTPSTRTTTPYRVQKLILRCPRTPNPIPSIPTTITSDLSNLASLPDFLPINAVTQLPDSPTPAPTSISRYKLKSKPKPRRNPRKSTPPPRKRKSTGSGTSKVKDHALVDVIPPVPPIPKTPDRTIHDYSLVDVTVEQEARLTPQNAGQGPVPSQSVSPLPATLRRSPRLSGVRPGQGL